MMIARGYPLPWSYEELDACFVITDSTRQKLAYVYFEDDPGRRLLAKLPSRDEALRIVDQLCAATSGGRDVLGF
jgi:hypothetical protein